MPAVLDEIVEQAKQLSDEDRDKLMQILQEQKQHSKPNGGRGFVHPNTVWIKKNHAEYAGKHVALKDGELIAVGDTIREVDRKAKEKGVENPLLTYLFPLDRTPFGGW
jgi:hypothetical protein